MSKKCTCCGAKHISKSKCTKHTNFRPLLEVKRSKKCTPLWREAHFEVKMYKTHQVRTTFGSCDVEKVHLLWREAHLQVKTHQHQTTFGSWDVEKVHAVVARSRFRSQNVQNTPCSDHFWKLRCRKSAHRCGAKHISKSKCLKHHGFGPLLKVQMWFCVAGARDSAPCQKWAKRDGFVAFPKTMVGVGHLQRICKDAFRVAGEVQAACSSEMLRGQGADFLSRGCILEHQICRFATMTLCDRCSTSYDLASILRGRRNTLGQVEKKIAKRIGTRPSALHSTFQFWRKSRRIASFLMLSTSKIEKLSQNSFVFDVVKFKSWGSLAEWLRFQTCRWSDR